MSSSEPLEYATPVRASNPSVIWRQGKILITPTSVELPPRCVKCNAPEAERYTKRVSWFPRWILILIVPGVLLFAIVAMILQKKATYTCGLCEVHAAKRRKAAAISWALGALSLISFAVAIFAGVDGFGRSGRPLAGWASLGGVAALIVAVVYASAAVTIFSATRIDRARAWYRGAGEAFLTNFPAQ